VAWIALTPLLLALLGAGTGRGVGAAPEPPDRSRALRLGLATGFAYFGGTLYWLTAVMMTFGGLDRPVAIAVNVLFVAYLALFPGLFASIVVTLVRAVGPAAVLIAPAVWVTTELARTHLLGGFPWVLLGYSQVTVLPIAQLASLFGVFGVSALVALVSAATAYVVKTGAHLTPPGSARTARPSGRWRAKRTVVAGSTAGVVLATALWGGWRVSASALTREGTPIRVGLVQGNVAQADKWNPELASTILGRYLRMSREAAAGGARFVIWPESSTPFFFEEDSAGADAVRTLARDTGVYLLFGSDQIERGHEPRFYNSAFLIGPEGGTRAVYRKMHLVPFGEYVPLKQLLFFVAPLVESVSDFSPGQEAATLPIESHAASTAICYEVVYPALIREFVVRGSELLTTITNDAWYGLSSAPYQHFAQAAMRSIEQGRYLARAANTGVSGIVDPYGRVLARTAMFVPEVVVGDVRFLSGRTLYSKIGDSFAFACGALTAAALLVLRALAG